LALLRIAYLTSPFLVLRLGGITLSDYLFAIAFIFALLQTQHQRFKSKIVLKFHLPILLIFVAAGLSVAMNENRLDGLITLIKFFILLIAIPTTSTIFCRSFSDFQSLLSSYMFGLIIFSGFTIISRIISFGLLTPATLQRSSGLAEHVTDAGGICTISLVACLILFNSKIRFLKGLILIIALFALGSTGSISGYISSLVGFLLYVMNQSGIRKGINKFKLPFLGVIAAYILNRYLDVQSRFEHATSGRYDTAGSRLENWIATVQYSTKNASNFFFGRGLHPKDNIITAPTGELLAPHNIILESLSAAGIFFAIGILIYLIQIIKLSLKPKQSYNLTPLLAASFIFAMTSPLMYSRYIWLPFLLALQQSLLNEQAERENA